MIIESEFKIRSRKKNVYSFEDIGIHWENDFDIVNIINESTAPITIVEYIIKLYNFSTKDYDKFFNIKYTTYKDRKNKNEKANHHILSNAIALKEIYDLGLSTFGDKDKFMHWLGKKNIAMGGTSPKDILHTDSGRNIVLETLHRIEYGMFA
ncbi:DUF2384 domain-containing protein [Flammeovirga pectinis]|uniref:DUF2384 domain-containing protein n=1 Tax=Flammeovirga pectinis TaxID=2494373 RepID=A0A3S9P132_9BACT|nr:antitoxin Xre/MbcA/ParS toxin-binding domain-containing protein [Flammeovirga pectinis]AZQ61904.1 DUF2384 domain-containing protein [Flammeovirga pectinis]